MILHDHEAPSELSQDWLQSKQCSLVESREDNIQAHDFLKCVG